MNTKNKMSGLNTLNTMNTMNTMNGVEQEERFDIIDNSLLIRSLEHTAKNRFLNYLLGFVDRELVERAVRKYFVGTTKDGRTVYWLIDRQGRARTGKIISYDERTGKRDKSVNPNWVHSQLIRHQILPASFQSKICLFGEHLVKADREKPVAIVEAEKTAVIASMFIDNYIWLAIGARAWLKTHKIQQFGKRRVVLYPDGDSFDLWSAEAAEACRAGMNVTVSDFIETRVAAEAKVKGYDLADYLIEAEHRARQHNALAAEYDAKIAAIEGDEDLKARFDEFYQERLAMMERETLPPDEVRRIVLGMF